MCLSAVSAARVTSKTTAKERGNSMIAKVIEMLGDEKDKVKADLAAEEATFTEYTEWCDDTSTELTFSIKTSKGKIEDLSAQTADNSAQIAALDEEIAELGNEIAERTSELEEMIEIRAKQKETFLKAEAEQEGMVEELEQLEVALKKQMQSFAETPPPVLLEESAAPAPAGDFDAFVQISHKHRRKSANFATLDASSPAFQKISQALTMMVNTRWMDPESLKNIKTLQEGGAFLQEGQDPMAAQLQKNEENLAAFEGLKGKAEEALQKMRDEEAKKQADHNVQVGELKMAIALANANVDDAKKEKARLMQEKATASDELGEVKASLAADSKSLQETQHECQEEAVAWEGKVKEATAEMAAIEKAKQILAERVTVLIQVRSRARTTVTSHSAKEQKLRQSLIDHFRGLGNRLHSLAMLNLVSLAAQDPMENVKNLLKELVGKLEKEAAEAASLHQFCQEEKNKTKAAMKKVTMTIEKLDTRLEKASSDKQELEESIATKSEELAAMDKANAEATKIRNEEHTNFMKIDADFSGAAEAVDDAIDALKEFYGDASFLQTDSETETTSSDSQRSEGNAGGIIQMLETMGEEFRKTVKENQATEREALKAYEKLMNDNKVVKATKDAEIKAAEGMIKMLDVTLNEVGEDTKMASKEKMAVEEYIEKLKPQCQGRVVPYAERKAKRDAEIAGLKEGLAILEADAPAGAVAFLQLRSKMSPLF
jgi:chromosome segregation ATPase